MIKYANDGGAFVGACLCHQCVTAGVCQRGMNAARGRCLNSQMRIFSGLGHESSLLEIGVLNNRREKNHIAPREEHVAKRRAIRSGLKEG